MKKIVFAVLFFLPSLLKAQSPDVSRIVYSIKDKDTLWMDDYRPQNGGNGISIVFVHGGSFTGGDPENQRPFADGMRKLGYRVFVLKYRLYLKGRSFGCETTLPEKTKAISTAVDDIVDASRYLSANAQTLGVDTQRMVLSGSSAGAEAILQTLYNPFVSRKAEPPAYGFRYRAAMSFAGALLDLNPLTAARAVPLLIFHGTNDQLVPYETAPHRFCKAADPGWMMMFGPKPISQKMVDLGVPCVQYIYEGAGHEISSYMFREFTAMDKFLKGVFDGSLNEHEMTLIAPTQQS